MLAAHPQFPRITPPTAKESQDWIFRWFNETGFANPRKYPVVFARLVDYADYFRRNFTQMPTRVVSYVTHDPDYDWLWTNEGCTHAYKGVLKGPIPVLQDLRAFRESRKYPNLGAPVSTEYIWYQSQEFHCRFERACPKPVRYYRMTDTDTIPDGRTMPELDIPDPKMSVQTSIEADQFEVVFSLSQGEHFADYMLAVWDVPREFARGKIDTNAKECRIIENTDGDVRATLLFDLEPQMQVRLSLRRQ